MRYTIQKLYSQGMHSDDFICRRKIVFKGNEYVEMEPNTFCNVGALYFHRESALRLFKGFLKKNRGNGKGGAEYNFLIYEYIL